MSLDRSADMPPRRPWTFFNRRLSALGLSGRALVILAPALWLTIFFLIPLAIVFQISLSVKQFGQPPYSSLLTFGEDGTVQLTLHRSNFLFPLSDTLYRDACLISGQVALFSTVIALFVGVPMGCSLARALASWLHTLL